MEASQMKARFKQMKETAEQVGFQKSSDSSRQDLYEIYNYPNSCVHVIIPANIGVFADEVQLMQRNEEAIAFVANANRIPSQDVFVNTQMCHQSILPSPSNRVNKVELLGLYGGDKTHCLSAWCSTNEETPSCTVLSLPDKIEYIYNEVRPSKKKTPSELLVMLAQDGHHTPFEKSMLHFHIVCDIATHIHFLKHRIGVSINTESARWKELKDKYYVPSDWPQEEIQKHIEFCEYGLSEYHRLYEKLREHYQKTGMNLEQARKRAKETSRFKLPYSNQVGMDISFNFRSFVHFIKLRYSVHAQTEIREVAEQMLMLVRETKQFNDSLRAFGFFDDEGKICLPFQ
jgi:thymidylate synthase (FAD)